MRTQVVIIGGGPAGLLLSHILHQRGVASVVLERQTRDYVKARIRAGVLEWGTAEVLRDAGLGERMDREGSVHDGSAVTWGNGKRMLIDCRKYSGNPFIAYGQTMIQEDLDAELSKRPGAMIDEAVNVAPHDVATSAPYVTFSSGGVEQRIDCDFIAGCDGFHGVSRRAIPANILTEFHREYPFAWLGVLAEVPPLPELVYANHERGFALASQRNPMLSRYYLQVPLDTDLEDWPDDRFWVETKKRFPGDIADAIVTGPSIEKSLAPLRSFVAEPMRFGNLFLAGDAAHIVPPTGAKGLNLAVSDVYYLSRAFGAWYENGSSALLDSYSDMALRRVWGAVRFSWWMTTILHRFPETGEFGQRIQESELDYLASSQSAMASVAQQYAGLPFEGPQ